MENGNEILIQHISEQIALEEHLYKLMGDQIELMSESEFEEARNTLRKICEILERHFVPLNELLNKLELGSNNKAVIGNGISHGHSYDHKHPGQNISRMLRDDYSALNKVTMSNTLLHTMALALDSEEIANVALKHLENLTPFVVKIGELVPEVVTKELAALSSTINLLAAQTALKNTKDAWKRRPYISP